MQPNYNQVPPVYQMPNFNMPLKSKVSPWSIIMSIMVAVLIVVLIQHLIGDTYSLFFKCNDAAVTQSNCLDSDLGNVLANSLITIPLFIVSLFAFVFYYKKDEHDPIKITTSIFFGSMLFNVSITIFEFIIFIYTKSPQLGFYITLLAFILTLGLGIFKVQKAGERKSLDDDYPTGSDNIVA